MVDLDAKPSFPRDWIDSSKSSSIPEQGWTMKAVESISAYVRSHDSAVERLLEIPSLQGSIPCRASPRYVPFVFDKVVISPLGRLVAEFYGALNGMADMEERRMASISLEYTIRELLRNPGNIHTIGFLSLLYRFHKSDEVLFRTLLKTFGALMAGGYDFNEWLRACSAMQDQTILGTFVEETSDIIETEGEISASAKETFQFFLSIWKNRLSFEKASITQSPEKRKYLRKRMRLSGYYHRLPALLGSEIIIRNLSPGGFSFEVVGEHPPKANELIQVCFVLDEYVKRGIQRLAIVKRWDGRFGGAQFHG